MAAHEADRLDAGRRRRPRGRPAALLPGRVRARLRRVAPARDHAPQGHLGRAGRLLRRLPGDHAGHDQARPATTPSTPTSTSRTARSGTGSTITPGTACGATNGSSTARADRIEVNGNRNGRPIRLHLDDGSVVDDERILEYAPSYRLTPLAAELFGGERVWRYDFSFNETDARLIALEYRELGECIRSGAPPEVTGAEGLADVALTYAPFESGRLGRPVTFDEMVNAEADVYQREIDQQLGLLSPVSAA